MRSRSSPKVQAAKTASPLMVRLDEESKRCLAEAAGLRQISVSDYVRAVTVPQARREIQAAGEQVLALTPEEQLSFWNALNASPKLTPAQRRLGAVMRGES
ncbi:MAG TPA: DUF1778 domain-containing protein [Thermoguttaceae bacterium]|nr:DUF1778 domain-containing protein [Thermoguttaceae bacterium]